MIEADTDAFWKWFASNSKKLLTIDDPESAEFDRIDERLSAIDEELSFSMSAVGDSPRKFIISANGTAELFDLVDYIIDRMPEIPGWEGVALNPPAGCEFQTIYEGRKFDPKAVRYVPVHDDTDPEFMGLKITMPGILPGETEEDALVSGMTVLLFTVLGERITALMIHQIEIVPFPDNGEAGSDFKPLSGLVEYLMHRAQKLGEMYERGELGHDDEDDDD